MEKRTFKVANECGDCQRKDECTITGIPRDMIYQNLGNAQLFAFVNCAEEGSGTASSFMRVKEEI